eukprot:2799128-Rhodomonas_salina.1
MYLTTVAKVLDTEVPLTDMSYIVRSRTYTENIAYTRESEKFTRMPEHPASVPPGFTPVVPGP